MPVSHKHEVILVHIPKTGGTSIEAAFDMHGAVKDVGIVPYLRQRRDYHHLFGAGMQHWTLMEIREFFRTAKFSDYSRFGTAKRLTDLAVNASGIGADNVWLTRFESYLKFAVVRNPYDRIVSGFAWLGGNWHKDVQPTKQDFSRYVVKLRSKKLYESQVHLLPQYKFLELDGEIAVDKVLNLEGLNEQFNALCSDLGVNVELPKRMVSKHKDPVEYYDEQSKEIVRDIYQKDFELFGYAK